MSTAMRTSPDLFTFTSATSNDSGFASDWLNAGTESTNNRTALALRDMMQSSSLNHTDPNVAFAFFITRSLYQFPGARMEFRPDRVISIDAGFLGIAHDLLAYEPQAIGGELA
jgi:hypothetical protein